MDEDDAEEVSPRGASDGAPPSVEQLVSKDKESTAAPMNTRGEIVEVMGGL